MDNTIPGPAVPPPVQDQSPADARIEREQAWATPDTLRGNEIQQDADQQGFIENLATGLQDTAAAAGIRLIQDEGTRFALDMGGFDTTNPLHPALRIAGAARAVMGERHGAPDYDKEKEYDRLTDGIPAYLHDEIMHGDSLASAERSRARVLTDIRRGQVMAAQKGASSTFALLAGSVADVDLPLTFMTGGGYKAAAVAGKALSLSRKAGLTAKAATRVASAGVGMSAGLQAGLITGIADATWSETSDWTTVGEVALQSMILGGLLNGAVNGDRQIAIKAAQDELHARVARQDSNLNDHPDVEAGHIEPILRDDPFIVDADGNPVPVPDETTDTMERRGRGEKPEVSTVNARMNSEHRPLQFEQVPLSDPAGPVSKTQEDIVRNAAAWRHNSGWADRKADADNEWWAKVAMSDAFNLTTNNFRTLYRSKSAVLNYLAGNVFESPHGLGRGGFTAATGMESYQRRIFGHITRGVPEAAQDWAKRHDKTMANSGYGVSQEGLAAFNREVMLTINDRALGRSVARDPAVLRAADAYDAAAREGLDIGRGKPGQVAVDGFDQIKDRDGYTPYVWDGARLLKLITAGVVDRKGVVDAMAQAYHTAAKVQHKDAQKIAEAVVQRAISRDVDVDMSVASLFTGDGREFLRQSLLSAGTGHAEVEAIMARFTGDAAERGKESFAKSRNEIDLDFSIPTKNGTDLRVVDLMSNDLHGVWQRYTRRMSGSAALARVGLNNKTKITDLIMAARAEQRSLGEEPMDVDLLRAMFSHFDGGPIHGYSRGVTNEGVGAEITMVKRMTNLSLLGKLGIAQLGETAGTIAQTGFEAWWRRGPMAAFDAQLRAGNKELLADMAYIMGDIGNDHHHFAPHLDLDNMSNADRADWIKGMSKLTSNMQWVQSYTSGFNHVRKYQQQIAALGMADKVLRTVKQAAEAGEDIDPALMRRFQDDLGLLPDDIRQLESLISNGTIEFGSRNGTEFVNRLNMDKWDFEFAELFGASMTRNLNQVVQKAMAGEQDAWMHTTWGSVITHLKTFPMLAVQKQFIRNMRHMDQQTLVLFLMGMATAGVATAIRDTVDGKERTPAQRAKAAFNYSNMTGWMPMAFDPVMSAVGLEDWRINAYGPVSEYTPAAVTWLNRASRLPGALKDTASGNADWYDSQSIKALPFANTLGLSRLLDG